MYSTPEANRIVELYRGPVRISQREAVVSGDGEVDYVWWPFAPHPQLTLRKPSVDTLRDGECVLVFPELEATTSAFLRIDEGSGAVTGRVGRTFIGDASKAVRLVFHLVNLPPLIALEPSPTGAAVPVPFDLTGPEIALRCDAVEDFNALHASIRAAEGYGITHTCTVSSNTGRPLPAYDVLVPGLLGPFFSFVRGTWAYPVLAVGFDASERVCWREWSPGLVTRHSGSFVNWYTAGNFDLRAVLAGFIGMGSAPDVQAAFYRSLDWYFEINGRHRFTEGASAGALMLATAAHELAQWTFGRASISHRAFKNMKPEARSGPLARAVGLPETFPRAHRDLAEFARRNRKDTPLACVAAVRNTVVHPTRAPEATPTMAVLSQAVSLSVWYWELIWLLALGLSEASRKSLIEERWSEE
jgi:hypothetical protein